VAGQVQNDQGFGFFMVPAGCAVQLRIKTGFTAADISWWFDDHGNYGHGYYLFSASNPGRPGGAPAAPAYSTGDGWFDYDNNGARGTITVTAGDGSAIGGGGGH
jgi:hypothetical protein